MLWPKKYGLLCLAVLLIYFGVSHLIPALRFSGADNILAVLAIVAGILIWLDR
jgi:hypothetical protein